MKLAPNTVWCSRCDRRGDSTVVGQVRRTSDGEWQVQVWDRASQLGRAEQGAPEAPWRVGLVALYCWRCCKGCGEWKPETLGRRRTVGGGDRPVVVPNLTARRRGGVP